MTFYTDFPDSALPSGVPTNADKRGVITSLPPDVLTQWNAQQTRYTRYWDWWTGKVLEAKTPAISKTGGGKLMYPLKINPILQFSRKFANVLFGESNDTSIPLVRPMVKPIPSPRPVNKSLADLSEDIQFMLNEVWMQSNGRAIQYENGTYTQFLGGCVFKVQWNEPNDEMRIPITIKNILPDHFIPVWQMDDMWNLLEAYVAYYVDDVEANRRYGITDRNVMYVEHWTREHITIKVGNKVIMDEPNPFGFVPFVYIPRLREGDFYGRSMVDEIENLAKEFNSRMANLGDTVKRNSQQLRYFKNLPDKNFSKIVFDHGLYGFDMGNQPHYSEAEPDVIIEPPVNMPDSLVSWVNGLWTQLLREASLGPIAFGEDEGSQRSALTLAFRMWPLTAMIDAQRTFWEEGLNLLSKMIIRMLLIKMPKGVMLDKLVVIPKDIFKKVTIGQVWNPKIPRDREQAVNEAVLLSQANIYDPTTALETIGDVRDIQEVLDRIIEWQKRLQTITSMNSQPSANKGAPTEIETPVAESGMNNE